MPRCAKWVLGIAGFLIAVPVLSWLSAWMYMASKGCAGNGAAADRARDIDEKALSRLYRETESMVAAARRSASLDFVVPSKKLPPTARSIGARYANIFGDEVVFNLSGCYDDKVFLTVSIGDAERPAGIALSPGEAEPQEILWPKPGPDRKLH